MNLAMNRKKEVFTVSEFLACQPIKPAQCKQPLNTSIYSFFPPITISAFFPVLDPTFSLFLIGGVFIAIVALIEFILASFGKTGISSFISGVAKFIFPALGYGLIFWFLLGL